MRALVTGGAGFVGSHLVDALLARGDEVLALDDLSTGRRENLAGGAALVEADVADAGAVAGALAAHRPEVVFHLAAQVDVRRSVADPAFDARVNHLGTLAVLEAARSCGARRVVYASTGGALYGDAAVLPTGEGAPLVPLAPYGASKLAGEQACHLYRRLHGLGTVALRYANVYGPRQDPLGEGGVVAIFCARSRAGQRLTIYGDGRQTRDFVAVEDVVAANLAAAASDVGGAFNVGTGVETSVLELAERLGEDDPRFEPARAGEVARSCLDARAAREALGWEPATTLAEGLARTLRSSDG